MMSDFNRAIQEKVLHVKPYTIKELCLLYEVTDKTLKKWLHPFAAELGHRTCRYYTVIQVEMIFKRLGIPYKINLEA